MTEDETNLVDVAPGSPHNNIMSEVVAYVMGLGLAFAGLLIAGIVGRRSGDCSSSTDGPPRADVGCSIAGLPGSAASAHPGTPSRIVGAARQAPDCPGPVPSALTLRRVLGSAQ